MRLAETGVFNMPGERPIDSIDKANMYEVLNYLKITSMDHQRTLDSQK